MSSEYERDSALANRFPALQRLGIVAHDHRDVGHRVLIERPSQVHLALVGSRDQRLRGLAHALFVGRIEQ